MRKIKDAFLRWFSKKNMRTKMALSFSGSVVFVFFVIMLLINHLVGGTYRKKILYSASQSYDQAYSFFKNYVQNMYYASELIYYNGDLQRMVGSENFKGDRDYGEQFREFLALESVFLTVEKMESIAFARIFIPSEISYSNNKKNFASHSVLESRKDYQQILDSKIYFTASETENIPPQREKQKVVSMFRLIRSTLGTNKPIAVEQIAIQTQRLQDIIDKSNITESGIVYVINQRGEIICSSSGKDDLLKKLEENNNLPHKGSIVDWDTEKIASEEYIVQKKGIDMTDWVLVALVPKSEIEAQVHQISFFTISFSVIAVIVIVLLAYRIAKYYTDRLNRLAKSMASVQNGNLNACLMTEEQDEIGQIFNQFNDMTNRLKDLMQQQYKMGKEVKTAQLQSLQAQINPHFLYNTLDLINWQAIDNNAPEIAEVARSLAKYYRLSLNRGRQVVSIGEELEHVKSYIYIENRLFDGAIHLEINVPEEIQNLACINIMLQPFVENSIVHGIAGDISIQECFIRIEAKKIGRDILFSVQDDGKGMTETQLQNILTTEPQKSYNGYGVKNVNSRIQLCYGLEYGLSYSSVLGKGTTVEIRIPALTVEEAEEIIT